MPKIADLKRDYASISGSAMWEANQQACSKTFPKPLQTVYMKKFKRQKHNRVLRDLPNSHNTTNIEIPPTPEPELERNEAWSNALKYNQTELRIITKLYSYKAADLFFDY